VRVAACAVLILWLSGCAAHRHVAATAPSTEAPDTEQTLLPPDWAPPEDRPKWVRYPLWQEHPICGVAAFLGTVCG
jgi:hypothetical protein